MIKKSGNPVKMMILFMLVYFISYVTRINYGAVILEIVSQENFLKSTASLALTGSAVAYGAGQLFSGYLGDKIQPKYLIFAGLLTTILMNLLIPFCTNPFQMTVLWSINGLAQAFMWPPLVKLMTFVFSAENYKKAVIIVSAGSSSGTIFVYLTAPLLIYLSGWRAVFILSAVMALIMAVIWMMKCPEIIISKNKKSDEKRPARAFPISLMLIGIMAAIFLQGTLRDGVATWMPSLISETFNLNNNIAILSGVIFPIFTIITNQIVSGIYRRKVHNELKLAGSVFILGACAALVLGLFRDVNPVLSVMTASLLIGSMHGINLMLICMVPSHYAKYGRVSFISGLFNSFTYLGSAVSGYGMAAYTEQFGWSSMTMLWCVIALAGGAICFTMIGRWRRFTDVTALEGSNSDGEEQINSEKADAEPLAVEEFS